ncbi:NAD(P)/FAD-dependent oxidoreductase [Agrococcus terreus]|uniref:dihydrolipoyl dehydrogenase family protein n=1 Tax=Agrococcus terreus TaxID=574649 RepID=UPI00385132A3
MSEAREQYDVAVIGAGPAGTAAALRARELGASVVVLEARHLGGTCVNSGCVPTRVLAKAARLVRDARTAHEHGVDVSGVGVDWPVVVERVHGRVDEVRAAKREAARFAEAGIDLLEEGRARFEEPHVLALESGRRIRAATIMVAVGGRARRLPVPGAELATMPDEVLHLPALPRRVAIIGGGNTGAQLTTVLSAFGSAVTLLDVAPRILMPSDASIAEEVTAAFRRAGATVSTGIEGVGGLSRADDGAVELAWREGGGERREPFDAVIMATGWPPDLDGLGLDRAGIVPERGAIPVDEHLRSAVPHVYAIGDANGRDMLVQAAQSEGEAAAEHAVAGVGRRTGHLLLPAGGFTDPDYAGVGMTEAEARERDPGCVVATVRYDALDRAVIDDRTTGFLKLVVDRRRSIVLGAHAVGENAIEVVSSVTTAMAAGVDVATLAGVRFAYPTYTAIVGLAARAALAEPPRPAELG